MNATMVYDEHDLRALELSVAMTGDLYTALRDHFRHDDPRQEDLTFAFWRPSAGSTRLTAVLAELALPGEDERILQGNVAFTAEYLARVLASVPEGCGVALLHSHPGPGWQDMSSDDDTAERDRLASAVAGRTGLPLVALTWGNDGTWSARFWGRAAPFTYERIDAASVRVVGAAKLALSFHPDLRPGPAERPSQQATISVWGSHAQADLARARVGIVGLGSVGSIVAEALSRLGVSDIVLIDHDRIEERNLDRILHASEQHVRRDVHKVTVAKRAMARSHTAADIAIRALPVSLLQPKAIAATLDCDVLLCCVDRPWPRWTLNTIAYAHLIPVIDGGILARVTQDGRPLHIDWRIHTIGPGRACLLCLGALLRSDAALDRDGLLDDSDYLRGLSAENRERYNRRNVFPFSLSVAAHEALHLAGMIAGSQRIAGIGPQHYAAFPGEMTVTPTTQCEPDCEITALIATAGPVLVSRPAGQ